MQINNLTEFLTKVFNLYGIDVQKQQSTFETYFEYIYRGISNSKKYNYYKALEYVLDNHQFRTIPMPAVIKGALNRYVIEEKSDKDNGNVWQGTIIAFKKSENGNELEYEFGFGGQAPNEEDTRKWLASKGLIIREVIRG